MHDFLLAKEIVEEVLKVAKEHGLANVQTVSLEIGQIAMAHDGHPEHVEDISVENLQFGLESLAKGTLLEKAVFEIKKVAGEHWRVTNIEGE